MAEATGLRNNALPYPVYGSPYGISFPILDADGDLVTGATGLDSEISLNGNTAADCTNEATEIATSSGMYYLLLTGTELTTDVATGITKTTSSGAKTTPWVLYPRKLVTIRSGTSASGGSATSTIVLDASASALDDYYNGMLCIATIDSNLEARIISDYTGSTQTATVVPDWNVAPDNNDTFVIKLPEGVQIPTGNTVAWNGTVVATPATAGIPDVNVKNIDNDAASASGTVTFPNATLASTTNITAGTITTVTNLTNAATAGDFTATMKTSIGTAVAASAVASVTGNVGGNVTGSVGSVVGNVGGNVTGSVGSVVGAVGSVTGNVGGNVVGTVASVVGAVGSVTGNVGGNVTGTIGGLTVGALADFFDTDSGKVYADAVAGSVVKETASNATVSGTVSANVVQISGDSTAADNCEAAFDGNTYNVGGGAIVAASVTGAVGSVTGAVGSVTGNVGGNVTGSVGSVVGAVGSVTGAVGSVTGNVGGNVTGSVGSVATGGIAAASFAANAITSTVVADNTITANKIATGAITAAKFAASAIDAAALATDAVNEIRDAIFARAFSAAYGALTFDQVVSVILASQAAITSGGATTTFTIRNLNDSADVIVATVDANGNRSVVTVTP